MRQLEDEISACHKLLAEDPGADLFAWFKLIDSLKRRAAEIDDIVNALAHEHGQMNFKELHWWVSAFGHQVNCYQRDAESVATWGRLIPELKQTIGTDEAWLAVFKLLQEVPTLAEVPPLCDKVLVQLSAFQDHRLNPTGPGFSPTNKSPRASGRWFKRSALAFESHRPCVRPNRQRDGLFFPLQCRAKAVHDWLQT